MNGALSCPSGNAAPTPISLASPLPIIENQMRDPHLLLIDRPILEQTEHAGRHACPVATARLIEVEADTLESPDRNIEYDHQSS